jgi:hypothetical protein
MHGARSSRTRRRSGLAHVFVWYMCNS